MLKAEGIHFYTTNSEVKASVVERFIRTLNSRMWRYFTWKNTLKYIDVLGQLVKAYNHSHHRTIQMKPVKVRGEDESNVWRRLYSSPERPVKFLFKAGDLVRISKRRLTFEKSYLPSWSEEILPWPS